MRDLSIGRNVTHLMSAWDLGGRPSMRHAIRPVVRVVPPRSTGSCSAMTRDGRRQRT
jgi:hypothetical protein